jgi:hypothetical protein
MKYEPSHRVRVIQLSHVFERWISLAVSTTLPASGAVCRVCVTSRRTEGDDDVVREHTRARFGVNASSTTSTQTRETKHTKLRVDFVERNSYLGR